MKDKDHRFITIERIFKNGALNFTRNIWLSIAAIAMMTITLTILLFAVVTNATFSHTVNDLTSHIDLSVYLKDSVTIEQKDKFIKDLYKIDNVKSVDYLNKDKVLANYQKANAGNTLLLSAISQTDNPLSAEIHIKPKDPNQLGTIKSYLDRPDVTGLQSSPTNYSGVRKTAIDNITRATHFFQQAGIAGICVFIVISILIILNTIRMAIFNRRDELIIMRLLGASTSYIRGPFVVETMMYGVSAALISIGLCAGLFKVAASTLQASSLGLLDIKYSDTFFSSHILLILGAQVGIGIIIGAVSSLIATRRYLKTTR